MGSINEFNPKIDQTVQVYDNFYNFGIEVDANEYDVVNSFFQSVTKSKKTAESFTTSIFRISSETNVPVLTILEQLDGQTEMELNVTLAYYLNGLRSPSTLLGVNQIYIPNYYAARNVLL